MKIEIRPAPWAAGPAQGQWIPVDAARARVYEARAMANLLTAAFEGLGPADFEVYARPCWASNQFNLGRMRTKERMLQLAAPLAAMAPNLELRASSEVPGVWNGRSVEDQWVYLVRPAAERQRLAPLLADQLALAVGVRDPAEHHRHAVVFVRLHHQGLEIGLLVHPHAVADRLNLEAMGAPRPAEELPGFAPAEGEGGFRLATTLPRQEVEAAGASIAERVAALAAPLLTLYARLAWSPGNDAAGLATRMEALADRHAAEAAARSAEEAAAHQAREARTQEARARSAERAEADAAWRRRMAEARTAERRAEAPATPVETRPAPAKPAAAPATEAPAAPPAKTAAAKPPEAAKAPKPPKPPKPAVSEEKPPAGDLAPGTRVRLSRGLLAGKEGTVTAETGKGYYKVKVGTLEVQVLGTELTRP